ncbi:hypothetical protein [Streptacidiphilus pinicola]|uniref:hypothetical protein n=1 Tax=Streptacidiphilus pinicola TaxID=2219663 RepID=UPI001403E4A8|nr:hypothetical protein [Streptacidiphilus pinicola]
MHMFVVLIAPAPTPAPAPGPGSAAADHAGTMAWLFPVLLGLLLTAIACYKHRGLPGGH